MTDDKVLSVALGLITTRTRKGDIDPHAEAMVWAEEYCQAMAQCENVERMHFWKSVRDRIETIQEQSYKE